MAENEEDFMSIDLSDDTVVDLSEEKKSEPKEDTKDKVEDAIVVDISPEDIEEVKPKKEKNKRKGKTKPTEDKKSTPEPEVVDVEELKEEVKQESVTIDFMDADQSEEFIKKKTQKSELNLEINGEEKESQFEGKTVDEIREEIKAEEEKSSQFKPENFEEIANLIIDILDLLMSALLKWYAKDTTEQPYSLSKKKKEKVTYSLALVMMKHQRKMSIELMFVLTIIGVYSGSVIAARTHRKEVKNGTAPKRGKGNQGKN